MLRIHTTENPESNAFWASLYPVEVHPAKKRTRLRQPSMKTH